jgi:hypothetical protein
MIYSCSFRDVGQGVGVGPGGDAGDAPDGSSDFFADDVYFGMIFSENRYPLFRIMLWRFM